MASYEDDHNLRPAATVQPRSRPRIDLSEFHAELNRPTTRHAAPDHDANVFRTLARAYQDLAQTPLMQSLIDALLEEADHEGKSKGVPEGFMDSLERVDKKRLTQDDMCCICNTAFLEDPNPLVVRLPCHPDHIFDLECVQPWLELHTTCPLDRKDLVKKATPPPAEKEDSEEEWDDMYG